MLKNYTEFEIMWLQKCSSKIIAASISKCSSVKKNHIINFSEKLVLLYETFLSLLNISHENVL